MSSLFRIRAAAGLAAVVASTLGFTSCASEFTRTGSSPSFIIIEALQGASGAEPDLFGSPLLSDVLTGGGTFNDLGQARMSLSLRNPTSPTGPSAVNSITLNRYRVTYRRSDGRNTPGVDVPHPFDGAITVTIPTTGTATFGFEVVRNQAKWEPPLANMRGLGGALLLSTLAEITFYGRDQAGNEVEATGTLQVNFADFADPSAS
jgi:hypothetical protein